MLDHTDHPIVTGKYLFAHLFQTIAKWLLIGFAALTVIATILATFGVWPWLSVSLALSDGTAMNTGPFLQIGTTVFMLALAAFLPGVNRMLALEASHRRFAVSMEDVARAYRISHDQDRAGAFAMSSEFDSVRDRLKAMREHPDLARLEPEVLELAAQMSHTTRDLAAIYSEEKVRRAKDFLKQRQGEIDAYQEQITMALGLTEELKRWQRDVETSERVINRQIDQLEADLKEVLPALGYAIERGNDDKIVPLTSKPAAPDRTN